mgnify:CR=1 FL=1
MKRENVIRLLVSIIFIFAITYFSYSVLTLPSSNKEYDKIQLKDDVVFQLNNDEPINVDLSEYSFSLDNMLDSITLTKVIPDNNIQNPTLILNLYHSIVEVYVDGVKIYDYGQDIYDSGKVIGHEFLHIPLPSDISGKELKIKMTFTEKHVYAVLPSITIENDSNYITDLVINKMMVLLVTMTLFLFGVIALFFSLTRRNYTMEISNITIIGLFCILISIWINSSERIIFLFIKNFQISSFLEYFSLYMAPILILIYFRRLQVKKRNKKLLNIGIGSLSIFTIVAFVAYVVFGLSYSLLLPIYHIIVLISGIILFYCSIKSFKNKKKPEKVLIYGMLIMCLIVIFDLLRFNVDKYIFSNAISNMSFISFAMLIFVISIIYSYAIDLLERYYTQKERKLLENFAYVDFLTSLNNRRKCEEIMKSLEQQKETVTIINCDINNLKYVNDTFGHNTGDIMIKEFATYLKEIFSDIGEVGRMGGDEFIVIVTDCPEKVIVERINELKNRMMKYNNMEHVKFLLSASIGYAIRKNCESESIWSVYEIADRKMYEEKRIFKASMN